MTWTIPDQGEPANDLQAVLFQSSLDALAAGDALTGVVSGCAVTAQGSPDMTVAIAVGIVSMLGAQAAVTSGNVTIGAADGTNPRLDLVVANASGTKSVLAGTAAANPKEPTLDTTTYVLLAQVYIPAGATSITTARITDRRVIVPGSGQGLGVYGDGSDGAVTFDGTTTVLGMAPASNVYTVTRDIYLAAGSTINSGVTLKTSNRRIFCTGTLTNNGTIQNNGSNGSAAGGGSNWPSNGPLGLSGGIVAGNGATGAGGTSSSNWTNSFGGSGGAGGAGSSGGGGNGGTVAAPAGGVGAGAIRSFPSVLTASLSGLNGGAVSQLYGGGNGGGGGGDGTNTGGGGGGGGGPVLVVAQRFAGTGVIQARGGNGANRGTGNVGGGGGGGGGWVAVISSSVSTGAISGQTIDANGGAFGTGNGTGTNGVVGANGTVVLIAN